MLKKQTVWLLTMLSLVVVLSVYYITADPTKKDLANVEPDETTETAESAETENNNDTTITQVSKDDVFEEIRLEKQDKRSARLEELQQIAGSNELSAKEKSEAKDEINRIHQIAEKEQLIESLIVQTLGYEDALVQADGQEVMITVKGQEPTKQKANEIIKIVNKEIGNGSFVTVAFQTENDTK